MFTVADSGTEWRKGEDGMDERTIKQVERLIELGPVTVPAYPDTTVAKRDLESAQEAEKKEDMRSVTDTERKYKQLRAKI